MNERPIRTISVHEERCFLSRNNPVKPADSPSGGELFTGVHAHGVGFGLNVVEAELFRLKRSTFPARGDSTRLGSSEEPARLGSARRAGSDANQVTNRCRRQGGVFGEQEGVKPESCQPLPNLQLLPAFPALLEILGIPIKKHHWGEGSASVPPDRCDLLDLRTLRFGCQVSPLSYTCCRVTARPWRRKSCNGCSLSSRTSLCVRIITGALGSFLGGLKRFNKQLGDKCCS